MTGPHGEKSTLAFANNIMIYKQTKNPDATKTFLKWWSENELPLWTQGHCGQLPARGRGGARSRQKRRRVRRPAGLFATWESSGER